MKKKGKSQSENLTFNHKSFESKAKISYDWSVLYIVAKI
jgi:hypothetical protein